MISTKMYYKKVKLSIFDVVKVGNFEQVAYRYHSNCHFLTKTLNS